LAFICWATITRTRHPFTNYRIIDAVASGKVDVAIVWGPAAGYFVARQRVAMEVVPVPSGKTDLPFAFNISMGVRPGDTALKAQLEKVLAGKQAEITKILRDFGVPLVEGKVGAK
jgi:mxaJ protein